MTTAAAITIVGLVLVIGAVLAGLIAYTAARLEPSLRAWHTEGAADQARVLITPPVTPDQRP